MGNQKKFTSNLSSQNINHNTALTGSEGICHGGIRLRWRLFFITFDLL